MPKEKTREQFVEEWTEKAIDLAIYQEPSDGDFYHLVAALCRALTERHKAAIEARKAQQANNGEPYSVGWFDGADAAIRAIGKDNEGDDAPPID